jgi:phosphohistidine phosphatase
VRLISLFARRRAARERRWTASSRGRDPTYADAIGTNGDGASRLLVIAHNPTIHATAVALAARGDRALRAAMAAKFPTCSLAVISSDTVDWWLKPGELTLFRRPKDLGSEGED